MATKNKRDIDDDDTKATPRFRVDAAQFKPPPPHTFDLPGIVEIRRLALCLDGEEVNISDFGERLASHQGLSRYVIAVANHTAALSKSSVRAASAVREDSVIREPTHAAAFLGLRGLRRVLDTLTVESSVDA